MKANKRTSNEFDNLMEIFSEIGDDKKPFAERLINQLIFMTKTLKELQDKIQSEGAVIECVNGNGFETYSEHPAQKSYNAMIKNYNATIKALIDLIPKENKESDELLDFIKGTK